MAIYKCKICGGSLDIQPGESITTCEYCGTKQTLPRLDDEKRANLYDRANHFRRNNDYDKAMGIYETILNEDTADAEAYWSILLCKYGIEYVEDPLTHKHMPTVNRTQYTSIFDDEDYKSALQYADGYQRELYEAEANSINKIQKEILAISQKEEPFDVFICYKETDSSGRRTQDSVLATELYHELTREGFKVFFSRITLEDKLGQEYEPYIFAALNSAKVMVVLGTKPEYFNAVWVKNEWNRYLSLIKNGARKALIPAYKNMDPYDLPDEFSHLQAQDMSKLGFMQDLIRGIKKLTQAEENKAASKETVVVNANTNISPLLKRAFMFLEDGDFDRADEFCEQVLNIDPECAEAYLGKLMAELNVCKQEDLADCEQSFENNNNYNRVLRFADDKLSQSLKGYILGINERNEKRRLENIYLKAFCILNSTSKPSEFEEAAQLFSDIKDYKDSEDLEKLCKEKAETARKDEVKYKIYNEAKELINDKDKYDMLSAIKLLKKISGWKDTDELIAHCQDKIKEIEAREEENRLNAERKREELRIAEEKAAKKRRKITIIVSSLACVLIVFLFLMNIVIKPSVNYNKGIKLFETGDYDNALEVFSALGNYKDVSEKQLECYYNKGLKLYEAGDYFKAIESFSAAGNYKDATEKKIDCLMKSNNKTISAGNFHNVGLKTDRTVIGVGDNENGQYNVLKWNNIIALSAGRLHTVGLKSGGTVVAVGDNEYSQCDVSKWQDIVAISVGNYHSVGLKKNGTVVAVGYNYYGQCDVSEWQDIVAISAGNAHTVGLKSDRTVVAVGDDEHGQYDVSKWQDIVAISAGGYHTVGLKSDGTVVAVGNNTYGQCNVSDWEDIVAISAGYHNTFGLKSDGTVVAVGDNKCGQCNVSDWKNIVEISSGASHIIGLKSDGSVVAVGNNNYGQCDVSNLKNIMLPSQNK